MARDAHVHGVAKLEVAQEGRLLTLRLESPLDNLLGFERAPRNDRERAAAAAMVGHLRAANRAFVPTPAAACSIQSIHLESGVLDAALLGNDAAGGASHAGEGHAELVAEYVFECAHPERLNSVSVVLFDSFKGFRRIDAQVATQKRQSAVRLTRGARLVEW